MAKKLVVAILLALFIQCRSAEAGGLWCVIHAHSDFSDGKASLLEIKGELIANDIRCVIFTEHYDCFNGHGKDHKRMIKPGKKQPGEKTLERLYPHLHTADNPIGEYIKQVEGLNEPGKFLAIAGVEYPFTKPGQAFTNTKCHIGIILPDGYDDFDLLQGEPLDDLAERIHSRDGIMIYNHPHDCPELLEIDKNGVFDIIEVLHPLRDLYNVINGPASQRDPGLVGKFTKPISASNDFHDAIPPMSLRLYRTFVWLDEGTKEAVLDALKNGRTFVSARGDRLNSMTLIPQKEVYHVGSKVLLDFDLEFILEKRYLKDLGALVYIIRDGEIVKEIILDAKDGEIVDNIHRYHIYFEDRPASTLDNPKEVFSYQIFADYHSSDPSMEVTGRYGSILSSPISFGISLPLQLFSKKALISQDGSLMKAVLVDYDPMEDTGVILLGSLDGLSRGIPFRLESDDGRLMADGEIKEVTDHRSIIAIKHNYGGIILGLTVVIRK